MTELKELAKINGETWQTIHQFLEWLSENKVFLAKYYGKPPFEHIDPISYEDKQKLIYGFFDTTPEKCEEERRNILDNLWKLHKLTKEKERL